MIRLAALIAIIVLTGCTLAQQGAFDLSTYGKSSEAKSTGFGNGIQDDTAELQAAINSTPVGGTLLISGRYLISNTLIVDHPMVIRGPGTVGVPGPGQIVQTNPNKDAIWIASPAAIVVGIGVWGTGRGTGTGCGIVLGGSNFRTDDGRITSCWLTGIPSVALDARGAQGYQISDCGIENSTVGLRIAYQTSVTDAGNNNVITNNRFYGDTLAGIEVCNGKWNLIASNVIDYCGADSSDSGAVWIHGPASPGIELRENSVIGNIFNINGSNAVQVDSSRDNQIANNLISRTQRRGVLLRNSSFCDVRGNTIRMSDRNTQGLYPGVEMSGCSDITMVGNSSSTFALGYGQTFGFQIKAGCSAITTGNNTGSPSTSGAFSAETPVLYKAADTP